MNKGLLYALKPMLVLASLGLINAPAAAPYLEDTHFPGAESPFLATLIKQAKQSSQENFDTIPSISNERLNNLGYSEYRAIRFKASESIWRGLYPYEVQLFHSGFLYKKPVNMHLIDYRNRVSSLPFSAMYFDYDPPASDLGQSITSDVGFAGFRVHYPLNNPDYKDEMAAFLGATYFRLIGQHQKYGLSARGLAVDTARPEGEEFPYFTDFWLIEPANGKRVTVYSKMDSPSITGIYKFTMTGAADTTMDVEAWLFAREDIQKLGIAPFTSMFLYGENTVRKPDDFRPEVHDSDGLMLLTSNNEQLWRPLNNPDRLRITSLADENPVGFGMLQRDIQYGNYLDSEADYHLRPGLWVTPQEGFHKGRLELVEIPTNTETHDNIVAYWVNDKPVKEGDELYIKYQLRTVSGDDITVENADGMPKATVLRSLQGSNLLPGERLDEDNLTRRFIIDFVAPDSLSKALADSPSNSKVLSADLSVSNGTVEQLSVFKTNFDNEIRATFLFTPTDEESVNDMRLGLTIDGTPISEIWTYVYER